MLPYRLTELRVWFYPSLLDVQRVKTEDLESESCNPPPLLAVRHNAGRPSSIVLSRLPLSLEPHDIAVRRVGDICGAGDILREDILR
jgi:hypothetical protein